jgi:hypothetical protein
MTGHDEFFEHLETTRLLGRVLRSNVAAAFVVLRCFSISLTRDKEFL